VIDLLIISEILRTLQYFPDIAFANVLIGLGSEGILSLFLFVLRVYYLTLFTLNVSTLLIITTIITLAIDFNIKLFLSKISF